MFFERPIISHDYARRLENPSGKYPLLASLLTPSHARDRKAEVLVSWSVRIDILLTLYPRKTVNDPIYKSVNKIIDTCLLQVARLWWHYHSHPQTRRRQYDWAREDIARQIDQLQFKRLFSTQTRIMHHLLLTAPPSTQDIVRWGIIALGHVVAF